MCGHALGLLEFAAVREVRGNAGRPPGVVADRGEDAGLPCPPADHLPGVHPVEPLFGEDARASTHRPEQRALLVLTDAGRGDVGVEHLLELMVGGHLVVLAAFLLQPEPPLFARWVVVADVHRQRRRDPREAVDEQGNERPVAQAAQGVRGDAVEELARLVRGKDRGLAGLNHVLGPAGRGGRVVGHDLADDEPVEEHPDCGEVLLGRRCCVCAGHLLDVAGDVVRADRGELMDVPDLEPTEEVADVPVVRGARVPVADVRGEKLQEPVRGVLASGGDGRRHRARVPTRRK